MIWSIVGYLLLGWALFEIISGETYLTGTIKRKEQPLAFWLIQAIYILIALWLTGLLHLILG